MNVFFKLTQNTFRECVREPVYFLLLLLGLCMIGILPMFSMFVFREQFKLVVDSAMATTLLLGLVTATLCASHTITREMNNGTVLLLLSKPVPRWSFIAAKLTGVAAALTLFTFVLASASFVSVMIAKDQFQIDFAVMGSYFGLLAAAALLAGAANYLRNAAFPSAASFLFAILLPLFAIAVFLIRGAPDDDGFIPPMQFIRAALLLFPGIWIMGAIAAALATRVGLVTNLTCCFLLFFLGLISRYICTRWLSGTALESLMPDALTGPFAAGLRDFLSGLLSTLLPNWQYFWMADALGSHTMIPLAYLGWAFLYSLLYAFFWSVLAMALFHEREVADHVINS